MASRPLGLGGERATAREILKRVAISSAAIRMWQDPIARDIDSEPPATTVRRSRLGCLDRGQVFEPAAKRTVGVRQALTITTSTSWFIRRSRYGRDQRASCSRVALRGRAGPRRCRKISSDAPRKGGSGERSYRSALSASSAGPSSSAVVAANVSPDRGRADASRVLSASPRPASDRPSFRPHRRRSPSTRSP